VIQNAQQKMPDRRKADDRQQHKTDRCQPAAGAALACRQKRKSEKRENEKKIGRQRQKSEGLGNDKKHYRFFFQSS
jgi:hypothetical protein